MKIKALLLTGLVLMAACDDSKYDLQNIVPDEYHKILYVRDSGKQEVTLYDVEDDYVHSLSIVQSGSEPDQTASANIRILSQTEVDEIYSVPEAVNYKILTQDAYSLETTSVEFSASDRYKLVNVTMRPQVVKGLLENEPDATWVLPLEVVSETDSINSTMNELFLEITGVVSPGLGFTTSAVEVREYIYGSVSTFTENIEINLDVENKWDLEWDLVIDEDYVASYNTANGTSYRLLPSGTYTLPEGNRMSLPIGTATTTLGVTITGADLQPGGYMLPIRMSNISQFEITPERAIYPLTINILGNNLNRTGWTAEATTSEPNGEGAGNGVPRCILDNNLTTFWHTRWQGGTDPLPVEIVVDAKKEYTFSQFGLVQRQHNDNRDTRGGEFYVSSDNVNWTHVGNFTMQQILENQIFVVTPTKGRYFKIRITSSFRNPHCSLSEVYAYGLE